MKICDRCSGKKEVETLRSLDAKGDNARMIFQFVDPANAKDICKPCADALKRVIEEFLKPLPLPAPKQTPPPPKA